MCSGSILEEKAERLQDTEDRGVCCETVPLRNVRSYTMKSHQHDSLNTRWTRMIPMCMPKQIRKAHEASTQHTTKGNQETLRAGKNSFPLERACLWNVTSRMLFFFEMFVLRFAYLQQTIKYSREGPLRTHLGPFLVPSEAWSDTCRPTEVKEKLNKNFWSWKWPEESNPGYLWVPHLIRKRNNREVADDWSSKQQGSRRACI